MGLRCRRLERTRETAWLPGLTSAVRCALLTGRFCVRSAPVERLDKVQPNNRRWPISTSRKQHRLPESRTVAIGSTHPEAGEHSRSP